MEDLKGLVQLVAGNAPKRIEIIGNPGNYSSKMQKLYEGILSERFIDDDEAAAHLYPASKNQKANFQKLKRRLHQRLLNTILFIDTKQQGFNDYQKAYYDCYKEFAIFKVMIGRGGGYMALPLAEKMLKKAIEYEFTDLSVNLLKELRYYYGNLLGNQKKFHIYNDLLNKQTEILRLELLAEEYYLSLSSHFVKSRASKINLVETAISFSSIIAEYIGKVNTQRFISLAYTVMAMRYQIANDYAKTLEICNQAILLLKQKQKHIQKSYLLTFLIKAISCNIQLGKYAAGEVAVNDCFSLPEKGDLNWYIVTDYQLLLYYHSGEYQKALEVYVHAYSLPGFNRLPSHYKEQWAIHEAYFHYLIAIQKISPSLKTLEDMGKFRLSKFLNEVPEFSKDKRGGNISLLIIQLLFLVQQKKYEEFTDRLHALEMYSHRYLRKDETYRSNCFIHMMLQIPKGYFNKKAVGRRAAKYVGRLKEVPLEVANQSGEIEFIPYETLWGFVLSTLKG
ncbi:MAG: hypothetical protein R2830_02015 [Saprospiraceae bacterium]